MSRKKRARNDGRPRHVTPAGRSVFFDLFEPDKATELEARSTLLHGLERWLTDSGMSEAEAAKALGVTQARISGIIASTSEARGMRTLDGTRILLAGVTLLGILAACSDEGAAPNERATLTLDADAPAHVCRLSYRESKREMPCDQVVTAMQAELHIPTRVRIVVAASSEVRYEELGQLIHALNAVGYATEFPSH